MRYRFPPRCALEAGTVGANAALVGMACCGPFLVQWLAQLAFALGGVAGLLFLTRFEAGIWLAVAVGSWLSWRMATGRLTRGAYALLGLDALLNAVARWVWDIDLELVLAVPPVYWPFVYRHTLAALLVALILIVRLVELLRMAVNRRGGRWQSSHRQIPHLRLHVARGGPEASNTQLVV